MLLVDLQQPYHDLQLMERHRLRAWPVHGPALRPRRNEHVRAFEFGAEAVLVAGDHSHHLNATAYLVWQCCDGLSDLTQIAAELAAAFAVDAHQAIDHVEQIVASLAEANLITEGSSAAMTAAPLPQNGVNTKERVEQMTTAKERGCQASSKPRTPPSHHVLGEVNLTLSCDDPRLERELAPIYSPFSAGPPNSKNAFSMQIRRVNRWSRSRFEILGDGEVLGPPRTRDELVPAMEWAVNSRVIACRSEFLQIHAASMVHPAGWAVLLVGISGCGKSTLAAALLRRGWKYLCDEFALINPQTLRAHPFPKPLCIKEQGFEVVRQLGLPFAGGSHYVKGIKGRVAYVNPFTVRGDSVGTPAPVRCVAFPQYARAEPRLIEISRARAMFGLAGGLLNRPQFGPRAPEVLHRLVERCECFALRSGDLESTCTLLESTLAERIEDRQLRADCAGSAAAPGEAL